MIFESKYRRQSLVSWENVNEKNKQDVLSSLYQKRDTTNHATIYRLVSFLIKTINKKS
jgi:hypothetical protein